MNTIRENIILELVARASVIASTGSPQAYSSDIGSNVIRMRRSVAPSELPCLVIWAGNQDTVYKFGEAYHTMSVIIEGLAAFGSSDPSVVGEQMLGDIIKAYSSPSWDRTRAGSPTPDNYIESIINTGGGVSAPNDGDGTVGASAKFNIMYWTAVGDPYAQ